MLIVLLPILLAILATLQYRWLGEISQAEQERMQQRLQTDVRRFAGDFNAEITKAFFSFQLDRKEAENAEKFAERFELWQRQTAFPGLVGEIYVTGKTEGGEQSLARYNRSGKNFTAAEWSGDLKPLLDKINASPQVEMPPFVRALDSIEPEIPAMLIPFFESMESEIAPNGKFSFKTATSEDNNFVIVKLDPDVIKNELVPELARRHFSDSNFSYALFGAGEKAIFTSDENFDFAKADAETGIFNISPDSTNILLLNSNLPRAPARKEATVVFQQKLEHTKPFPRAAQHSESKEPLVLKRNGATANVRVLRRNKTENTIIARSDETRGNWILKVSHADGSLASFVNKARWRNLSVSFGILGLLGASVVLLFLSTHRMQRAAQRQLDFVSSVTHEFRTPVAVICSAGDNLADGIVSTEAQIERYGKLIRREGNRLSEMVEQILEFAGARAKRKKYDVQPVSVGVVIEDVLNDCQPLVEEKDFALEKDISAELPDVLADAGALKQSIQNLVNNALKYGGENRWLRISAEQKGNRVLISVEDRGIGIPAREVGQIFEPFYRGKQAVAEQIHGNGLGLSLVKQIVEAHGGELRVESKAGTGSRFTIEFPAAESIAAPQKQKKTEVYPAETV